MKGEKYRNILMLIILSAVALIAAQVYFTIQNYRVNQQRFINDVQIALDLSVEKYFSDQARTNIKIFTMDMPDEDTTFLGKRIHATVSTSQDIDSPEFRFDTVNGGYSYQWSSVSTKDSVLLDSIIQSHNSTTVKKIVTLKDEKLTKNFKQLTDKVMLSFSEDLLDLGKLFETVKEELERKNLSIEFSLKQQSNGLKTKVGKLERDHYLTTNSKSSYLGNDRLIQMNFENATLSILKKGISDLVLSILLIGLVIGTMLYLYQTINQQKQLAEIKDDLISNITHEFKTPIATIFSALEGVTNFNESNDPVKTKKYLSISNDQLKKLNSMVEKLLETATIDKGKLKLNREEVELVNWTQGIVDRFKMVTVDKSLFLKSEEDACIGSIDSFHLENALANLIDNAIKYGGDEILVKFRKEVGMLIWEVEDNGGNIPLYAQERLFEKLYRVPKGNTHDVKGFGIGLYYARSIAKLHDGTLTLEDGKDRTLFRLTL